MGAGCEQNILETFKSKISECIIMVGMMSAKDRISVSVYNLHYNLSKPVHTTKFRLLSFGTAFLRNYRRLLTTL